MEKETVKLIVAVVVAAALVFIICYWAFVLQDPGCALAGKHYDCTKIGEGIYRCVVKV